MHYNLKYSSLVVLCLLDTCLKQKVYTLCSQIVCMFSSELLSVLMNEGTAGEKIRYILIRNLKFLSM